MRRRLALIALAVSLLVVLAFLVPLALIVRNQAAEQALLRAERDAQAIAAVIAVAPGGGRAVTPELAGSVLEAFGLAGTFSVVFPSGETVGVAIDGSGGLEDAHRGSAFTRVDGGGAEVLVPVVAAGSGSLEVVAVVHTAIPPGGLNSGVRTAWLMLGALALFIVAVAVFAADRLARSVVRPVGELAVAARALGAGDLETRVEPSGPEEVADVMEAFNYLAWRLRMLLSAERESVADLSHRLRTPLTALRLQVATFGDGDDAVALLADIEALERAVDNLIEEARHPVPVAQGESTDLGAVVRHRATFWKVLADDQGRLATAHTEGGELPVALSASELGALVDTLIENVFAHTAPGTPYSIDAHPGSLGTVVLVVEDAGPGFAGDGLVRRGASTAGSTGLGLDIVTKAARRAGGELTAANTAAGGARVTVTLPRAMAGDGSAEQS